MEEEKLVNAEEVLEPIKPPVVRRGVNKYVLMVGLVSVLFVIGLVAGSMVNKKKTDDKAVSKFGGEMTVGGTTLTPTMEIPIENGQEATDEARIPTPAASVIDIPEGQIVYYGRVGEQMGFFVTNKEMQGYVERGMQKTNPYQGQLLLEDNTWERDFDFRKMNNPKIVMNTSDILLNGVMPAIGGYLRNDKTGMLYLVINSVGNKPKQPLNIAQVIYRVDLYYGRVKRFWVHQIGDRINQKGGIHLNEVWHDEYMIVQIDNCLDCVNREPFNWAIVNIETKASRYLGNVTNIREIVAEDKFSYRPLVAVKEACTSSDPVCEEDGEKTVYRPSAKTVTDKLP